MSVLPRTLRFRVVMMLLVAFLLAAGVFVFVTHQLALSSTLQLENAAVAADTTRASRAVSQVEGDVRRDIRALASTPDPVRSAATLGLDFTVAVAPGSAVDSAGVVPAAILQRATSAGGRSSAVGGIAVLPEGPAAIAAYWMPDGRLLVGGRYLEPLSAQVSDLVDSRVTLAAPSRRAALGLTGDASGVRALSDALVVGWTSMPGLNGAPALLIAVSEPRPLIARGQAMLDYLVRGISLLSVLVGLSVLVTIEGSVFNRLERLRDSLAVYQEDADALGPAVRGSDEIADLAVAFSDTLGKVKASEEAYRHDSRHDHLTGLANRRRLVEDSEVILSSCSLEADHACCTLVLLDLDEFKQINDELGHQVGDEVLIWFAEHMRRHLRADSTLCRLGGDEFAVLMPRTDRQEAEVAVERLREAVSGEDENPCFGTAKVHFSVGYAVAPDHGETLEMLFQCADTDLYANKRGKSTEADSLA